MLAVGQGLKGVIDHGFGAGNAGELDRTLALMLVVIVVMAIATYTRFYFVSWLGERVTADLRRAVFDHLLRLPPGFFEVTRTGEVISRLTNDTTMLETVIGSSASMAVRNLLLLIGGLVMLAITSTKLTLLVLLGVPLVVAPIMLFGRRVRKLARASQDRVGDVGAYVDEALHEIRTVQAYGHEAVDRGRFGERVEAAFETARQRIRQRALLVGDGDRARVRRGRRDPVDRRPRRRRGPHQRGPALGVRVLRGDRGRRGRHDQRGRRRSAARGRRDRAPVRAAGSRAGDPRADESGARCRRPRAAPSRSTTSRSAIRRDPMRRRSTASRSPCAPARTSRWSGPSGAGKTTVFQLLLRFYDPQAGVVRIDGVDLRTADPQALRARLAVVPQDPVIFAASVLENVRYGRPDATEAEVRAACEAAYAAEFVESCPRATRATSASAACGFPAGSGSGSRSPARSSPTGRSCCSTKRRARSTRRASGWSSSRSSG